MDQPIEAKPAAAPPTASELAAVEIHRSPHLRWYHLEEPESPVLDRLAQEFGFHELEIEDCRHLRHTAKLEEYENHIFLISNTIHFVPETLGVWFGELDIFLGQDFVVTVHAGPTRSVRETLPRVQSITKMQRPDRVVHSLLDNMVDRYLPVLDEIGDRICQIEDEIHASPTPKTLEDIFALRRGLTEFRRVLASMREMVNAVMRLRAPYFRADMAAYWRDLYDHIIRAMAEIELQRELLASVLEVYLTSTANRTNEIMKVLTIYATIVLPMVVITGYFGMNFEHLPFMEWRYGVHIVNGLMIGLTVGLLLYFRKKRWM
ncbi:MAG TPA: magnesium/cobalt transporter CorA [Candidatus Xenobia bacterium]|nr:magnesium/cobalt transporter CorA [Candidatus Xenobia bacterium]